ncbi:MAG: esterase-like activity of phytase family protein [bacterium]|nr:esterase-like activity of phytase family protein [bacterium]
MNASLSALAFAASLTLAASPAQTVTDRLLVANKADHTLSIFDPDSLEELATLPTGEGPHEVAISPDGRMAVVTDYGAQKPGRTLTVVDVLTAKITKTIDLARALPDAENAKNTKSADAPARPGYLRPHGIQFVRPGQVLVTSERARRLVHVDLARGKVMAEWPTPQTTMHMVALGPRRRFAAATSIREGSLALFDLRQAKVELPKIIETGAGAEGLAVHPETGEVWVGNRAADTVSLVDPKTAKVSATLDTAKFPFRVAFTPSGDSALVSCAMGGTVEVWDPRRRVRRHAISITGDGSEQGAMPMGLCVDPDGKRCFVACGRGEFIAVLDLAAAEVTARIPARAGPDGIGFARIVAPAK